MSVFICLKQKRSCPEGGGGRNRRHLSLSEIRSPKPRKITRNKSVARDLFHLEAKRESIHHCGDKAHRYRGRSSSGSCGSPGSKGESVYPFSASKKTEGGSSSATSTRAAHLRNKEGRCAQFAHFHSSDSGQLISGHQVAPLPSTARGSGPPADRRQQREQAD